MPGGVDGYMLEVTEAGCLCDAPSSLNRSTSCIIRISEESLWVPDTS